MNNQRIFIVVFVFVFSFSLISCQKKNETKTPDKKAEMMKMKVPVKAAISQKKLVPVYIKETGTVTPHLTVEIRSRVTGELLDVHFKDGDFVKKGDLLFSIDEKPLKALLDAAQSNLLRDKVRQENLIKDEKRYHSLVQKDYVTKEQYDRIKTDFDAIKQVINADEAAIQSVKTDLSYCKIYSPVDGRAGSILIQKGNMINANTSTPLVVINKISPVYITFSVPEKYLPHIQSVMKDSKIKINAYPPEFSDIISEGALVFIDNQVDSKTGTIILKGEFPNEDKSLWAGQYVKVKMFLSEKESVVVPSEAIQMGQKGEFVFVINPDNKAEVRQVKSGQGANGETVVLDGLKEGEKIVTDGHLRLFPDAKVIIKE